MAFVNGKRCLGGMLELLMHCHYVVAVDDARFGWPEVTLPVVPGMEGCHWPFRRTTLRALAEAGASRCSSGAPVKAKDAVGWLVDYAGPMEDALETAWKLASGGEHGLTRRPLETGALSGVPQDVAGLPPADDPADAHARAAIMTCIQQSCGKPLSEALALQARIAAEFLASPACREGRVGAECARTMAV